MSGAAQEWDSRIAIVDHQGCASHSDRALALANPPDIVNLEVQDRIKHDLLDPTVRRALWDTTKGALGSPKSHPPKTAACRFRPNYHASNGRHERGTVWYRPLYHHLAVVEARRIASADSYQGEQPMWAVRRGC